jgi:pimeloyl-ACP methyl ester carboxylesterase
MHASGPTEIETVGTDAPVVRMLAGLAADDYGSTDARHPLVLLHGLTFSRGLWGPVVAALQRIDPGRRILVIDLPGHGDSQAWPSYDMDSVAEGVHRAVEETHLQAPVVVGHSIAAIIATRYAGIYATSGVVNIDQSLRIEPFAVMVQALADKLRGPAFPAIWENFMASMHIERLPIDAQELVRSASHPVQEVVLGYWQGVLERPVSELVDFTIQALSTLRGAGVPYLVVAGEEPQPAYREWLNGMLPQATVTVWPDTGHFPHLAHPARFAERLAATA